MSDTYISRSTAIAARLLGDEMMIMSAADSTLFILNETASILWQAADGRTPLQQIAREKISTQLEIDPETACRDAEEFAQLLAVHGVLKISDHPILDRSSMQEKAS